MQLSIYFKVCKEISTRRHTTSQKEISRPRKAWLRSTACVLTKPTCVITRVRTRVFMYRRRHKIAHPGDNTLGFKNIFTGCGIL